MTINLQLHESVCIDCGTIHKYIHTQGANHNSNTDRDSIQISCSEDNCRVSTYNPRCPADMDELSISSAGKQSRRYIVEDDEKQHWYQVYKQGQKNHKTWHVYRATACNCTFADYHSECPHLNAVWQHIENHSERENILDSPPYDSE